MTWELILMRKLSNKRFCGGNYGGISQAYANGEARTLRSLPRILGITFDSEAVATGCTEIAHPAL